MTFLEAKKIVEERGYRIAKNIEGESFRERVAREELEEAKRIAKAAGYQIIREDEEIEDDDEIDEGCCGCGGKKKKGKKKGKKSEFVPFWAKKKDGKLNEDFGDTEGTTFTNICQDYVSGGKFFALVAQLGLQGAIEKVLADIKTAVGQGIGDRYYNIFATRLRQSKSSTDALYKITNAMLAGENMDSAAGTRQSAYNRNRGVGRGRR